MEISHTETESFIDDTHTKRLINVFWAVETVLLVAAFQRYFYQSWMLSSIIILAMFLLMPVYFLAKKGKTILGTNFLLSFLAVLLLSFSWSFNGLHDEVIMVFPAIIMVSLLMGSYRFSFIIFFFIISNLLAMGLLNDLKFIQFSIAENSTSSAVLLTIIFSFISYVAWLISGEMHKTHNALRKSKNELENRVKARTEELEQSIVQLKSTQSQLIENEKMASLGRLVAGVAHEINTPIGIAITASSYLEDSTKQFITVLEADKISKQRLMSQIETTSNSSELIKTNLIRAAALIQGFKEVAVDQSNDEIRRFKIQEYLNEIIASLHPQTKKSHVTISMECLKDLELKTFPGSLAQIITNLVINSITHGFEQRTEGEISIKVTSENKQVRLVYQDNGCGILAENLSEIFDPFFTTKRGRGGSGLGLHITYNLVTQSLLGTINCSSELGKGTTFVLTFPSDVSHLI